MGEGARTHTHTHTHTTAASADLSFSSSFLSCLRALVRCVCVHPHHSTPTGVKHLHAAAVAHLDLAVYFEANGHGTALFSPRLAAQLKQLANFKFESERPNPSKQNGSKNDGEEKEGEEEEEEGRHAKAKRAASILLHTMRLVNQAIGDALSMALLSLTILSYRGWVGSAQEWQGLYTDLPSRMLTCAVKDRNAIRTVPGSAERRCQAPEGLQAAIDAAVAEAGAGEGEGGRGEGEGGGGGMARAFVRPSGTEDVVRVYAEASTQAGADALAKKVEALVQAHAA